MVCGAWPYINSVPHLGTLIGSELSADVFARYMRSKGDRVLFVSGSDEHGTPIELQAMKEGVEPQQMTDRMHELVKDLFSRFRISFDNYSRTHSKHHIEFSQKFFLELYSKGYVFKEAVQQLHCNSCLIFLPDRFVIGKCPNCSYERARGDQCERCGKVLDPLNLLEPKCAICGSEPTIKSTDHWFLDLPALENRVKSWFLSNPRFPETIRNFTLSWLMEGLKPRPITRDTKWGIPAPFPGSEGKTIYVWFEAVLGYITASIEWAELTGDEEKWREFWYDRESRSVYFIGKDNIPFHTIILPALLIAHGEGLNLPWNVLATEYLTYEGQKFSKSAGVGVWLDEALDILDPDYWRFYLIRIRPETSDSNFSAFHFRDVINDELNDVAGNFVHRVLSFLTRYYSRRVPTPGSIDEASEELLETIPATAGKFGEELELNDFRTSINLLLELARRGNVYLSAREPWATVKSDPTHAATTLYVSTQLAYAVSVLLEPITPAASELLRQTFRLPQNIWCVEALLRGKRIEPGHEIAEPAPAFSKVSEQVVESLRGRGRDNRVLGRTA
ncbi:MAG: methionine--tRNA ligase [Thaumarchaeota archaeon]|nr:methionine--tRNA ligase [Candidatus Calditenuaceae archaeon]MDW8187597.1 methionine--tRNA ligase [Nitrososphaerota archaeon]